MGILIAVCLIAALLLLVGRVVEGQNKSVRETNLNIYNSIKEGMSYGQVLDLIGVNGELVSEDYEKDENVYIWYLGWYTRSKSTGSIRFTGFNNIDWDSIGLTNEKNVNSERSYIRLIFQDGKVVSKEQKGLENT